MVIAKWILLAVCVYFTALPLISKRYEDAADEGEKD